MTAPLPDRLRTAAADHPEVAALLREAADAIIPDPPCPYHSDDEWPCVAPIGHFYCTRPKGHDGDHVACGGDGAHVLARSPQLGQASEVEG